MSNLKYEYKELYNKITNNDIIKGIDYVQNLSKLHYNYRWLVHFNTWGKWLALIYITKSHLAGNLMSKTEIAKQVVGMSRDGALKWIDCLIEQELLFKHHDPSVQIDKRKIYIIPNRHITEDFCEYIKVRLLMGVKHIDQFMPDASNNVDYVESNIVSIKKLIK